MNTPRHLNTEYLDLLEKVLLYSFWPQLKIDQNGQPRPGVFVTDEERESGQCAWPANAFTMINAKRLANIRNLCQRVRAENIPGGFAECGVWRGGACIYARACLPLDRTVFVCDSFDGFPVDAKELWWQQMPCIKVSQAEVETNFKKFGLLENVRFVSGFFKNSLASVEGPLSILRVDADMHRSTFDALNHLWPKVSPGGFLILDDYNVVPESKAAAWDYFEQRILPVIEIDGSAVWMQKERSMDDSARYCAGLGLPDKQTKS